MWETQLEIRYEDYEVADIDISQLMDRTLIIENNITPSVLKQLEGTEQQSASEKWFMERWLRLTASKCLTSCRIGKLIVEGKANASVRAFKFISTNIWGIEREPFQSYWMKYGLESEPKAILKYEEQTRNVFSTSGLWVNPKYPFLACSPDGLVDESGLLEIKSLKIFKDSTVERITGNPNELPKEMINGQCFYVKDGKCILKRNHDYYYQVQMQLLVTEREFCDFVLYAENGPVSVQRIERDEHLIQEILKLLTAFWKRVIAPGLIEMRVPRNLMPFVLPDMKNAPDGIKVTTTSDTENMKNAPDGIKVTTTSDTGNMKNAPDGVKVTTTLDIGNMTNAPDSIKVTTTLNTGNEYNCSHTKDEMAVADCLINALRTSVSACPSLYSKGENQSMVNSLIVIP